MNTPNRPPCIALLGTSSTLDLDKYIGDHFRTQSPGIDLRFPSELGCLEDIDAALCWFPPHGVLKTLPNLKLIQSLAAGIDHITADAEVPRNIPVCRIVDTTVEEGMASYVSWAVIQHHRGMRKYLANADQGVWKQQPTVWPRDHRVGIAGFGVLGAACARALSSMGYPVSSWNSRPKSDLPNYVKGFHGSDQLPAFLAECASLVCLLPLTEQTRGFLGARVFSQLPRGAHVVNVGRGGHVVEEDVLAALESGQLSGATLDAFSVEPLPKEHPFWSHPAVVVTPHIAAHTDPRIIAEQTLANLASILHGHVPNSCADVGRGY